MFVGLGDVNYPDSTYTVACDDGGDQFRGVYFQATVGQSYDVMFTRLPAQP